MSKRLIVIGTFIVMLLAATVFESSLPVITSADLEATTSMLENIRFVLLVALLCLFCIGAFSQPRAAELEA